MNYRCPLPEHLQGEARSFVEFANGGAQATVGLNDGRVFHGVLISNGVAVIAVRGWNVPPFEVSEIAILYQTEDDKNPTKRDGWQFWDTLGANMSLNMSIDAEPRTRGSDSCGVCRGEFEDT